MAMMDQLLMLQYGASRVSSASTDCLIHMRTQASTSTTSPVVPLRLPCRVPC
jgi:hypothetical protein